MSRAPHCTPFRVVPWYTRNLPLTTILFLNVAAQRICIQATNAVFLFCEQWKMKLQRECVTGVTLYPVPSRPLVHAQLAPSHRQLHKYMYTCKTHCTFFSSSRRFHPESKKRANRTRSNTVTMRWWTLYLMLILSKSSQTRWEPKILNKNAMQFA